MALFDTNAFRISEQGLSVLWQKQQIIAENIANADTPDYNCKYLDFAGIFRDKLRSNGTVDTEIDLVQRLFIDRVTDDQADGNNVQRRTAGRACKGSDTVRRDNELDERQFCQSQIRYDNEVTGGTYGILKFAQYPAFRHDRRAVQA